METDFNYVLIKRRFHDHSRFNMHFLSELQQL